MKNLVNPEVKKSSAIILIVIISFSLIINCVLYFSFNGIKHSYINGRAAVIGKITETHPELVGELVNASFEGQNEDLIARGNEILATYGYDEDLKFIFLPEINASFKESMFILSVLILVLGAAIIGLNYWQYEIIYSRIRLLTKASKEILEGNYNMNIYEEREGDFAKLSFGFNNMRTVIQSQMIDLKKEKEFLVNLLSDISHQLKTPLAALVVYNDILSKPDINEENKNKFLENSKKQLNRMEWLIKSMLKLAKVDARAIDFCIKENNLSQTVAEVFETLKVMAQRNKVNLCFEEDSLQDIIYARYDEQWLGEALINIIKNCVEHSGGGKVTVSLEETPINIKIIIKDNGEGIEEEDLPNIFKRFYKGGKSDSVGIGLSLSKSIVEAQDGYIEVNSKVNVGTKFKVILMKNI
ncbi:MAG: HAMP domain-containing sensor histidine kinase [Clostridium sp.]